MTFKPDPKQTLLMLRLIFGKAAPTKTELSSPEQLKQLQAQGLVYFEKRGRSSHVLVTDKGWQWTQAHLNSDINPQGINPGRVLQALLPKLQSFLERRGYALAELFEQADAAPTKSASDPPARRAHAALRALSGGKTQQRLTLAQARAALPDLSSESFDQALLELQEARSVALMHEDNPDNRSAELEAAAIRVASSRYHLVYLLK